MKLSVEFDARQRAVSARAIEWALTAMMVLAGALGLFVHDDPTNSAIMVLAIGWMAVAFSELADAERRARESSAVLYWVRLEGWSLVRVAPLVLVFAVFALTAAALRRLA